ncbi:MAG: PQQ-dependent sugar dehydrogenase [Desulfobacteraceae bacterium]|nr:PQQ-dependent sugar dehydrogenase [Desulfobacteraceae bacterium]
MRPHYKHTYWLFLLIAGWLLACGENSHPSGSAAPAPAPTQPAGGAGVAVTLEPAFASLSFSQPTALVQHPSDPQRWYVLEKSGVIRTFAGDSATSDAVLLDITGRVAPPGEGGLLNMVFDPDFSASGAIYIYYTGTGSPLTSYLWKATIATMSPLAILPG